MTSHARARARDLRDRIAREAARLLAEGEAASVQQAKLKAALRLGVAEARSLPSHEDVELALSEYQRLFMPEVQGVRLGRLRETALRAMRLLTDYEPRAFGPAVTAVLTEDAAVCLLLYCDAPEEIRLRLEEVGIPHRVSERRWRSGGREETHDWAPLISFMAGEVPVELTVLPERARRHPPPVGADGRPLLRMDLAAMEKAIAADAAALNDAR
ncbi:MAG TPA: hypothetical protein DCY89_00550 [Gammaproteobacteria bacterium]|nr:hypothetical protein [Gammaproteobacteria bacterium]